MNHFSVDVVVLGSGFAGSLAALLLAREGRSVALIESGKHPRFAIGESSTPLADFKLEDIGNRFDLPRLKPLARYGSWINHYPHIMRGVKRGFSYFSHHEGRCFQAEDHHGSELIVTANSSRESSDTHWLRSDVDAFMVEEAVREGAIYLDETLIESSGQNGCQQLIGNRGGQVVTIDNRFLIIATGNPQLWKTTLTIPSTGRWPRTKSRTVFAHFANMKPWGEVMRDAGISTRDHPFDCDQAALHHVFDGGWMWQLRFDDETTSAGFMFDVDRHPCYPQDTADSQWRYWLSQFPSIKRQFADARIVRPQSGLQQIDRLQQELRQVTGDHWALLPAAVGYSDPLFSTGIGHALFSVEALVLALRDLDSPSQLCESLAAYSVRLNQEIDLIDRFVSLAYRASSNFEHYVLATMPYFAAATTCERLARRNSKTAQPAFLLADNEQFLAAMNRIEQSIDNEEVVRDALKPFNQVGLLEPDTPRMYRYTSAK